MLENIDRFIFFSHSHSFISIEKPPLYLHPEKHSQSPLLKNFEAKMFKLTIREKNLHLLEKRDVLSYTLEEFEAMDEERQLETLWLQMDACLEEIAKERSP